MTFYQLCIRNINRQKGGLDLESVSQASVVLSVIFNKDKNEIFNDIYAYVAPVKKAKTYDDKAIALQIWSGGDIRSEDVQTDAQVDKLWKQYGKQVEDSEADEELQDKITLHSLI